MLNQKEGSQLKKNIVPAIFLIFLFAIFLPTHVFAYGQNYKPEEWKHNINYVFLGTISEIQKGEILTEGKYHEHRKMKLIIQVEEELIAGKWNEPFVTVNYNSQIPKENISDNPQINITDNMFFDENDIHKQFIFTVTSFELIRMGKDESRAQNYFLNNSYAVDNNAVRVLQEYQSEENPQRFEDMSLPELKRKIAEGKKIVENETLNTPTLKTIVKIIDPLTMELDNAVRVKLIGIEILPGKEKETEILLKEIALNRKVKLEYDKEIIDPNDHNYLLTYVYIFDCGGCKIKRKFPVYDQRFGNDLYTFLNATLIKMGLASPKVELDNKTHEELFAKIYAEKYE